MAHRRPVVNKLNDGLKIESVLVRGNTMSVLSACSVEQVLPFYYSLVMGVGLFLIFSIAIAIMFILI